MRLLLRNITFKMQTSLRILILFITLNESLFLNCYGSSSVDGISLQFNKRGKREKICKSFYFICTSAHEIRVCTEFTPKSFVKSVFLSKFEVQNVK